MIRKRTLAITFSLVPVLGMGSGAEVTDREASGLTVASQPPATLVVDGEPRGETPITLEGLTPGEHRIHLVKTGYQTLAETVDLAPGHTETVSFALQPRSAAAGTGDEKDPAAAPKEKGKKKGSKLKWIVPSVVVAGGGTAAAVVVANKNTGPKAGLTVTPTGAGMVGATTFRFDGGQSSDPDGDRLTYAWNFGDGTTGTGQSASHMYSKAGTYAVSLTVYDGKEAATSNGSARVNRSLAGVWKGTLKDNYGNTYGVTLSLNQSGNSLLGTYADESGAGSAYGSISATDYVCPCRITITVQQAGFQSFTLTGDVNGSISSMSVAVQGSGFRGEAFTLTLTSG